MLAAAADKRSVISGLGTWWLHTEPWLFPSQLHYFRPYAPWLPCRFVEKATSDVAPALYGTLRNPFPQCASPFTLLTLLERHCAVGLALTTELDHLLLPASLACTHMQLPAPQAVLTAVLQARPSLGKRAMVQEMLCRAAKVGASDS